MLNRFFKLTNGLYNMKVFHCVNIKKIKFIIFVVLCYCLYVNCSIVKADYTCAYKYSTEKGLLKIDYDYSISITFNTESKTIKFPDGIFDEKIYFLDKLSDATFTEKYIVESLNGGCPENIVFCSLFNGDGNQDGVAYSVFYVESNFYNIPWKSSLGTKYYSLGENYEYTVMYQDWCGIATVIPDESTGEIKPGNFDCDVVDNGVELLEDLDCGKSNNCNLEQLNKYNEKKQHLQTFCTNVFEHANYGLSPCLKKCLQLDLDKYEFGETVCGFSGRLILFVGNIIKWCKYIVPVIAIVLSILDFIKAIGAGKEDEMKKAQGKFIKRLIVAGLVFIMPFIIEFILNKMGFEANGCGIIDL